MNLDEVRKRNDDLLRREILRVLYLAKNGPTPWLHGDTLMHHVRHGLDPSVQLDDESHAIGLCQTLVNRGYLERHDLKRAAWEPFGLRFVEFRITARGEDLKMELIAIDPQVADDRAKDGM
jgi:hypothetical protein